MSESRTDKVKTWLEFWSAVLPEVLEAVQALFRRHDGDEKAAIGEIRKVKDHWSNAPAEDADFQARIAKVAAEDADKAPDPELAKAEDVEASNDEPARPRDFQGNGQGLDED
jgi:hypothetical protein